MAGVGYALYSIINNSTSMLIVGLFGIILVLLFAMASGYGRGHQTIIVNQKCDNNNKADDWMLAGKKVGNCVSSKLVPAGVCPTGYTNFTDGEGNTLCCGSSNVEPYSHKCPALGPKGICAMAPGIEDTRPGVSKKTYYPLCQTMIIA